MAERDDHLDRVARCGCSISLRCEDGQWHCVLSSSECELGRSDGYDLFACVANAAQNARDNGHESIPAETPEELEARTHQRGKWDDLEDDIRRSMSDDH